MDRWLKCLTPQVALFAVAWFAFCIVVIRGVGRRTSPVRKRFRALLVAQFGMRPCCPHCEEFIAEPRAEVCPNCGGRLRPRD